MSSVPPFPAPPTSQPPTISHVKALVAAHPSLAVRIRAARGRSKAGAQKWVWTVEFDEPGIGWRTLEKERAPGARTWTKLDDLADALRTRGIRACSLNLI
jgi:hypothetical protein